MIGAILIPVKCAWAGAAACAQPVAWYAAAFNFSGSATSAAGCYEIEQTFSDLTAAARMYAGPFTNSFVNGNESGYISPDPTPYAVPSTSDSGASGTGGSLAEPGATGAITAADPTMIASDVVSTETTSIGVTAILNATANVTNNVPCIIPAACYPGSVVSIQAASPNVTPLDVPELATGLLAVPTINLGVPSTYQPNAGSGILTFNNFGDSQFDDSPEPSTFLLIAFSLAGLVTLRMWRSARM